MGLIKTAILASAGVYTVNKLTKTAESRHDSRRSGPNNRTDEYYNYPPQGPQGRKPWGSPSPAQRGPPHEDSNYGTYPEQQQQRQWFPPAPKQIVDDGRYARGQVAADYEDDGYTPADGEFGYQARGKQYINPPAYSAPQGYVMASNHQEPPFETRGRSSPSSVEGLAGIATQFMSNNLKGDRKKSKKLEKGSQMVTEFFGK